MCVCFRKAQSPWQQKTFIHYVPEGAEIQLTAPLSKLAQPCIILFFYFISSHICLNHHHILSHAPSLISHLFFVSITCLCTLLVYLLPSSLLTSHFQVSFFPPHIPQTFSVACQLSSLTSVEPLLLLYLWPPTPTMSQSFIGISKMLLQRKKKLKQKWMQMKGCQLWMC